MHFEIYSENYTISGGTLSPSIEPTAEPSESPTTEEPTAEPTELPTNQPSVSPTQMPTPSNTKIHMECYENSCSNTVIDIWTSVQSAHIHCAEKDACKEMIVNTHPMGTVTNISITCYVLHSCTDLNIMAGDQYVQLHMYKYSEGIHLYNGFGWSSDDNTITCDRTHNFIMYDWDRYDNSNLTALVDATYTPQDPFPCDGIEVHCYNQTKENGAWIKDGSCNMSYVVYGNVESYKYEKYRNGSTDPQCI